MAYRCRVQVDEDQLLDLPLVGSLVFGRCDADAVQLQHPPLRAQGADVALTGLQALRVCGLALERGRAVPVVMPWAAKRLDGRRSEEELKGVWSLEPQEINYCIYRHTTYIL